MINRYGCFVTFLDTQTTITTSMPLQATETTTTTTFVSTDQEKFGQVHQNLPEWTTPPENVTRPHHHATENFGTREDSSSGNDNDRSVISPKIAGMLRNANIFSFIV